MIRRARHVLLAAALTALAVPAAAQASYKDVIRDCAQDGQLDHHYSQHELDQARHHIPADVDEYTDCRSAILAAMGKRSGSGPAPPSNPSLTTSAGATAYNKGAYDSLKSQSKADSKRKSPPKIGVGSHDISAGGGPSALLRNAATANSIPSPVLISLVALGCLTLAGTSLLVTRRFPGVRRVALRIFRR